MAALHSKEYTSNEPVLIVTVISCNDLDAVILLSTAAEGI